MNLNIYINYLFTGTLSPVAVSHLSVTGFRGTEYFGVNGLVDSSIDSDGCCWWYCLWCCWCCRWCPRIGSGDQLRLRVSVEELLLLGLSVMELVVGVAGEAGMCAGAAQMELVVGAVGEAGMCAGAAQMELVVGAVGEAGMCAGAAQMELVVGVVVEAGMCAGAAQRNVFGLLPVVSMVAPEVSESGIYAGTTQYSSSSSVLASGSAGSTSLEHDH